jgi:hypothetical protein
MRGHDLGSLQSAFPSGLPSDDAGLSFSNTGSGGFRGSGADSGTITRIFAFLTPTSPKIPDEP